MRGEAGVPAMPWVAAPLAKRARHGRSSVRADGATPALPTDVGGTAAAFESPGSDRVASLKRAGDPRHVRVGTTVCFWWSGNVWYTGKVAPYTLNTKP